VLLKTVAEVARCGLKSEEFETAGGGQCLDRWDDGRRSAVASDDSNLLHKEYNGGPVSKNLRSARRAAGRGVP